MDQEMKKALGELYGSAEGMIDKAFELGMKQGPYERNKLYTVLVLHQRVSSSHCSCGWSVLGASHVEHVLEIYEGVLIFEEQNSDVELTPANDRGFLQSEPTLTDYGSTVQFRQSSSAEGPRVWMYTEQPVPKHGGALKQELGSVSTHMTLKQAEEIHAKLGAHIAQMREDWCVKPGQDFQEEE